MAEESFKFLISANFHLGKSFKDFPNSARKKVITAQEKVFDEFISLASSGNYAGAIIVGDLFDSPEGANMYAKKVFEDFRKVIITGSSMLLTTGNTDPETEGDFWTTTVTPLSFSFYKSKSYTSLATPKGNITVGGIGFDPENPKKRIAGIIPEPKTPKSIVVCHGQISGENDPEGPSHEITESELENLSFSLVVLGHSHEYKKVGSHTILPGSPQGLGFERPELGEKFFAEVEILEDNTAKILPIKVNSAVELATITFDVSDKTATEIQNEISNKLNDSKIYKIDLTGEAEKELFLELDKLSQNFKLSLLETTSVEPKISMSESVSLENEFYKEMAQKIRNESATEKKSILIKALKEGMSAIKSD